MAGQFGGNPYYSTGQVSVGTTPVQVVPVNPSRFILHLGNESGTTVYIGAAGVTPSTGYPILGSSLKTVSTRDALYAVVASGTETLSFFEEHA